MQFIDLAEQQSFIRESLENRIKAVFDHGKYIMGPEIKELEDKCKLLQDELGEVRVSLLKEHQQVLDDKVDKLQCDLKCGLEVFNIIEQVKDLYRL